MISDDPREKMNKDQIEAALNFLEGSPEDRDFLSRVERLADECEDGDLGQALQVVKMVQNRAGILEVFKETKLVCKSLHFEQMTLEQKKRCTRLIRPFLQFQNYLQYLQGMEEEGEIKILYEKWTDDLFRIKDIVKLKNTGQ